MTCAGCGTALPTRPRRGRPARYHGPACRQRAHRARVAFDGGEHLALIEAMDTALGAVRRQLLLGRELPDSTVAALGRVLVALGEHPALDTADAGSTHA